MLRIARSSLSIGLLSATVLSAAVLSPATASSHKPAAHKSAVTSLPMRSETVTPEEYRARYNLKADYPMVSPNYSAVRRDMAKRIGLGRKPGQISAERGQQASPEAAAESEKAAKAPRKPRTAKVTDEA